MKIADMQQVQQALEQAQSTITKQINKLSRAQETARERGSKAESNMIFITLNAHNAKLTDAEFRQIIIRTFC